MTLMGGYGSVSDCLNKGAGDGGLVQARWHLHLKLG